ncbi:single-stranded DNA-binding protein [Xenococcus sp. PCC 7305]|uniref:single-stranded DNA-binding protein n=1 Tax=Xenococcus sp. PCC 7305 TaxID=102125 RepID=UPI0002AC67FD|nr:single-stranded DNA-binding protein [Xenococcus sp. PCC 7305]ELS01962.1 single-stranded DNA-binding protein [Xenococcus sp. PCC 7305]
MNSCVLMAQIVSDPELRQTQDGTNVANMLVEFAGSRPEDPPSKLRVVGWGGLAEEISQQYKTGDRVIIDGRLSMNLIDMPEGYKEKRAELVISRIFPMDANAQSFSTTTASNVSQQAASNSQSKIVNPEPVRVAQPKPTSTNVARPTKVAATPPAESAPGNYTDEQLDDIPF